MRTSSDLVYNKSIYAILPNVLHDSFLFFNDVLPNFGYVSLSLSFSQEIKQ